MTPGQQWQDCPMLYATHVEVDLAAIAHNVAQVRAQAPQAQVLVAVKANAYGHGAVEVARHLASERLADWFGIATIPEGIELREAGISQPIVKFSPALNREELEAAVGAQISLTVHDAATIDAGAEAAEAAGGQLGVHLAIDTGMRRIGCEPEHAAELAARIAEHEALRFEGIFTHLPISDTAAGDEFTRSQLDRFKAVVGEIQQARSQAGFEPVPWVHAANSGAIISHDPGGTSMVRPGIMAYGYDPTDESDIELRQAVCWKSQVSYVKRVRQGETVGYGRSWTAPTDRWIATVPIGYADGYSRLNSNRGRMLINGTSYPIAGRVCMDQTMVDLGSITAGEPAPAEVGDEVVVLGRQGDEFISTEEMAELMGTITYEVTCLIAPRVTRVHLR